MSAQPAPSESVLDRYARQVLEHALQTGRPDAVKRVADSLGVSPGEARGPALTRLADVTPEPVRWLWPGRFARGKVTLIAGDPGLGKSFLTLDLAARVSTGMGWPDAPHERREPGGVVLLSAEDDITDTIRPRLDAAGADCTRIEALTGVRGASDDGERIVETPIDLTDTTYIEQAIEQVERCKLIVIDPVSAYMGRADSHVNAEVRAVLAPLADLAARHDVAIVAVTHLRKGEGQAIYRAMGSLAFVAAARAAWAVVRDADDPTGARRLLLPVKNNLAADAGTGLAFELVDAGGGTPCLRWSADPITVNVDEALARPRGTPGPTPAARDEAADWLRGILAGGPVAVALLREEGDAAGFTYATLRRAKETIGARSVKLGMGGGWAWGLPAAEGAQPPPVQITCAPSREPEHLRDICAETGVPEGPKMLKKDEGAKGAQVAHDGGDGEHLRAIDPDEWDTYRIGPDGRWADP